MAQTSTRSTSRSSGSKTSRSSNSRTRSNARSSNRPSGRKGSSRTRRTSSNGSRSGARSQATRAKRSSGSGARSPARSSGSAIKRTGEKAASLASKAKTPLVAGGAALAGVAGVAVAIKSRANSRGPLKKRLNGASVPKSIKKIDADTIKSAARRAESVGHQIGDIAEAAAKTRKKNS